jgi:hypothetical protein
MLMNIEKCWAGCDGSAGGAGARLEQPVLPRPQLPPQPSHHESAEFSVSFRHFFTAIATALSPQVPSYVDEYRGMSGQDVMDRLVVLVPAWNSQYFPAPNSILNLLTQSYFAAPPPSVSTPHPSLVTPHPSLATATPIFNFATLVLSSYVTPILSYTTPILSYATPKNIPKNP